VVWELFTLKDIMKTVGNDHVDILKIDIEGGEWYGVDDLDTLAMLASGQIRQIITELHWHPNDYSTVWNTESFTITSRGTAAMNHLSILDNMLSLGWKPFAIAPNTPHCLEISFIKSS
jgi:hypothetical protein